MKQKRQVVCDKMWSIRTKCFHFKLNTKQVIWINHNKRFKRKTEYKLHGHTLEVVDSGKYLGVNISSDLSWHTDVDVMAAKASKTLGFLRRNLSECTKEVERTAYITLVRPIMEYASPAWDPSSNENVTKLEKVQ